MKTPIFARIKMNLRYSQIGILVFGVWCLVFGTMGCGYTTRTFISEKFKTIYIAQFENKIDITKETDVSRRYKIYRPLLETDITRAVIDRFVLNGNLRLAKEEDTDLSLKGALVDYRRDPVRYTRDNEEVEEYRISIIVELSLLDKQKNLLWEEKGLVGDATYFVSGPHAKSETLGVDEAVKDLARRIVERVIEDW